MCSNGYSSIRYWYGNISLNNVNSSANRCRYYSGVLIYETYISHITQSTFSNNTDDNSICIGFSNNSHHMSQCNIIRNLQMTSNDGTFYNWNNAETTISNCIIDMNIGANYNIYVDSGSVTLNNCYIQTDISNSGTITIISAISDSNSLILYHFDSYHCEAVTIGPTPLDTTPFDTIRETTPVDTLEETPLGITPVDSIGLTISQMSNSIFHQSDESGLTTNVILGIASGTGVISISVIVSIKYFYNFASEAIGDLGEEEDENNAIVIMIQQSD